MASTITIDGGSGTGKSTVGRVLAGRLGWRVLDTGLAYRGLACLARDHAIGPYESDALAALGDALPLSVPTSALVVPDYPPSALEDPEIADLASIIGTQVRTRSVLTRRLREIALEEACVVVGRDAGTAILPEAGLRMFLTAPLMVRAARRARQARSDIDAILPGVLARDRRDYTRAISPLRCPERARVVDTTRTSPAAIAEWAQLQLLD